MAGSRRSPLMRDYWRASDDSSVRPNDRVIEKRPKSPSGSKKRDRSSEGLRIRGRADKPSALLSEDTRLEKNREPRAGQEAARDKSPATRQRRGDERFLPARGTSSDRIRGRSRGRAGEDHTRHGRSSHSRSRLGIFDFRDRDARRLPPSPVLSRFERGPRPSSRRREHIRSPPRATHRNRYPSNSRFNDSYIPSTRRHSRSPVPRDRRYRERSPVRGRSRSRERASKYQKASLTFPRRSSHRRTGRSPIRDVDRASTYRPRQRSRESRKGSPSRPRANKSPLRGKSSSSPSRKRRRRDNSRDTEMQHPPSSSPHNFVPPNQHSTSVNYPLHGMRANEGRGSHRPMRPPRVDTRLQYSSSPQWTPTSSHHGSPHSASPYGPNRGGWNTNAYSPPHRHNSYPPQQSPQASYYPSGQQSPYGPPQQQQQTHHHHQQTFHPNGFRGGHNTYRGNAPNNPSDRRSSGPGPTAQRGGRGRPGFYNLQWTANSRLRDDEVVQEVKTTPLDDDDNPFRPSKDLRVDDETEVKSKDLLSEPSKESSKISFAFKAKASTAGSTKPPPDLASRIKDPARKANLPDNRTKRPDKKGTDDRAGRNIHEKYPTRDDRHSLDTRHERDRGRDRARERSPQLKVEKQTIRRTKPKRTLSPDLAESTSVYYRKPGNESVIGSGTYGKVFRAVHVYTKNMVALKKIRMDGEKDGFPVTAVREIKLLQSLRHENVVSLQEVMVEHNDCYMVFEYLSHDLTGLLNHPTFKLEASHKKHLAKQLFEGLSCLHRRGVLHRDIKAANILISSEGQLKLADFGLARFYSKRGKPDYTNRVITIWYRSPELLLGETQYGPAVDIWSAACVMVEIFTRHAIFPGDGGEINQLDKIYNVLGTPSRSDWPGLLDMAWFELLRPTDKRPTTFANKYQEKLTPAAFELLTAMFAYNPDNRPAAADVLEHPYFTAEEPAPRQAFELKDLQGDWHEFESKALRKENERKHQEAKRAARNEEHERERAKRRASGGAADREREPKRQRPDSSHGANGSK